MIKVNSPRVSILKGQVINFKIFFFNDTATPEIYPLSLHDALPISGRRDAAGQTGSGRTAALAQIGRAHV